MDELGRYDWFRDWLLFLEPMISGINKQKRIEFSKKFIEKDIGFWGKVLWSDETMVRSIPTKMEMFHKVHKSVKTHDLPKSKMAGLGSCFGVASRELVWALWWLLME